MCSHSSNKTEFIILFIFNADSVCYLTGIHFDLIIVIPLRVPLDASPVMYLFHDWALGVLHTKIIGALTLMGPNWWLKAALDQVCYIYKFIDLIRHERIIREYQ